MKKKKIRLYDEDGKYSYHEDIGENENAEGELITTEEEWLNESLSTLRTLKLNAKNLPLNVQVYIGATTAIINYFLQKKRKASGEAKRKKEMSLKSVRVKTEKHKKHFLKFKKEHDFNTDNSLISGYCRNRKVKAWYQKQSINVPVRSTLETFLKNN